MVITTNRRGSLPVDRRVSKTFIDLHSQYFPREGTRMHNIIVIPNNIATNFEFGSGRGLHGVKLRVIDALQH